MAKLEAGRELHRAAWKVEQAAVHLRVGGLDLAGLVIGVVARRDEAIDGWAVVVTRAEGIEEAVYRRAEGGGRDCRGRRPSASSRLSELSRLKSRYEPNSAA